MQSNEKSSTSAQHSSRSTPRSKSTGNNATLVRNKWEIISLGKAIKADKARRKGRPIRVNYLKGSKMRQRESAAEVKDQSSEQDEDSVIKESLRLESEKTVLEFALNCESAEMDVGALKLFYKLKLSLKSSYLWIKWLAVV